MSLNLTPETLIPKPPTHTCRYELLEISCLSNTLSRDAVSWPLSIAPAGIHLQQQMLDMVLRCGVWGVGCVVWGVGFLDLLTQTLRLVPRLLSHTRTTNC